jgi:hypothetical protein
MKKIISFCVLLALTFQFTNSYGQQNKFAIGIEAGANLGHFYGNPILKKYGESTVREYRGISLQYNINRTFSLHTGLAYEQKGHHAKLQTINYNGMPTATIISNFTYSYLTVPAMVRATFGKRFRYFVNLGPYAGYALKQISKTEYPQAYTIETDDSKSMKQTDFGISAGSGIAFPVDSKLDLSLEIRNNLGLVNISKVQVVENESIKTNTLNLLIGLSYKIGNDTKSAN